MKEPIIIVKDIYNLLIYNYTIQKEEIFITNNLNLMTPTLPNPPGRDSGS